MPPGARTLVVGAGGLLGRQVLESTGGVAPPLSIRWSSPTDAVDDLDFTAAWMARQSELRGDGPWRVAWCAGAGFVGATDEALRSETAVLTAFLDSLATHRPPVEVFFLASSGGAVYAGSGASVLDETTPVVPTSAYGEWKVAQERAALDWSSATGVPVLIGRISNLFGPGQDLSKPQGLLSRMVRASLLRQPLTVFVDLDTRRDYLYSVDAGRLVAAVLEEPVGASMVRVLAAGRTTTVSEMAGELGRISRKHVPLVFARTAQTDLQPKSLAFESLHADDVVRTPLPVALRAVYDDQMAALQVGALC